MCLVISSERSESMELHLARGGREHPFPPARLESTGVDPVLGRRLHGRYADRTIPPRPKSSEPTAEEARAQ